MQNNKDPLSDWWFTTDRGWTRRHGLFLLMGGFVLCNKDGQPIKTLSFPHFQRLVYEKVIDLPHLTSLEIQERSNLHPALAFIALLQATWFVAQCLVRFTNASPTAPGFPVITQFEAMTLPLVIANWCIFLFAWKKPLDARRPILIKPNNVSEHEQPRRRGTTVTEIFQREENTFQSIERRFQLECPQSRSTSLSRSIFRLRLTRHTLTSILLWPVRSIWEDLYQLLPPFHNSNEFSDGTLKIPLFYTHTSQLHVLFLLLAAVLGMGVSIVSFLFLLRSDSTLHFPSESVKLVWRITSITLTSLSALTLGLITLAYFFDFLDFLGDLPCWPRMCCYVEDLTSLSISLVLYIDCRVCAALSRSFWASRFFCYLFKVSTRRLFCEPVMGGLYPPLFLMWFCVWRSTYISDSPWFADTIHWLPYTTVVVIEKLCP